MKFKINWGTGIVIAMISFMVFILSFVYKSVTVKKYQHELVSKDYYGDELHYQEEIDKLNKSGTLSSKIKLKNVEDGILILFPSEIEFQKVTGTITFKRMSNESLDFTKDIKLISHEMLIPDKQLVAGKWSIIIDWELGSDQYLFKESWFY